jgi:hypothetical protein
MKILIIIACVILFLSIVLWLFFRIHIRWLDKQTPVGVWNIQHEDEKIILQFEHGSKDEIKEGIYKQLAKRQDGSEKREFGHWWSHKQQLRLIILASDTPNHPRFGQDTIYEIWYVGPDSIKINGPDRPGFVYQRAPKGMFIDFDKDIEPER